MSDEINIMVGGEAGQGVQSVGAILARTLAWGGLHVFADQDYESRVRGGHNFFRVRASRHKILALRYGLDLLIALDRNTLDLHRDEAKKGGLIIFDEEQPNVCPPGVNYICMPLVRLAEEKAGNRLMANTVAVGAVMGLAGYDLKLLTPVLASEFGKYGAAVMKANEAAALAGYDFIRGRGERLAVPVIRYREGRRRRLLLNGNEALALGAMSGGCRFIAAYPMTPASSIMEYMADKGRDYGVVTVHVEDEISGMNMAVGAGFAGARSMIATSGGGFALMVEALALAGMTETPVVAFLGQRPGPATGLPTRTEQAELMFVIHAGHGEFPRAVLAPATAGDAFHVAVKAFNLAEKYQTPVLILGDHHLSTSYCTVDRFDLAKVKIDRGLLLSDEEARDMTDYKRHAVTRSGVSPRALPGQGRALVVTDSDEHNEAGHMIEDAATRNQQVEKRLRKLAGLRREVISPVVHRAPGAAAMLIGWGSTYGAIREAAEMLEGNGLVVSTLHLSQVWPFPAATVASAMQGQKTIVVEGNATAQLAGLLRRETGLEADATILRYDGRPHSPEDIAASVRREAKKW
jgi:2-oxoglutarate ferredoxin oxidoreductase subunit alpha